MCGIFGFAGREIPDEMSMWKALNTLRRRGPDQKGKYADNASECKLWMGHRRLSIIDLSKAGRQPFITPDKKVAVSVNGEIYNYRELRDDLRTRGAVFYSNSDSEVLLWGFYYEGESFFRKLRGMFAAAIWDRKWKSTSRLLLIRDRLGIKPLYYWFKNGEIAYASELKAITALPTFRERISAFARDQFFSFGYIPAPCAIYENTFKLVPGEYAVFEKNTLHREAYWKIEVPQEKFRGSLTDAENELDAMLNESVREELVSDVPIGAFLSGGIDSSLVCAIIQRNLSRPLKTFTIGFESNELNESYAARQIADYLGTEHTETVMNKKDLLDIFPHLFELYDEPFQDASALPTFLLSKITRKNVTVALSGDGGDELFFGYNSFPIMKHYIARLAMIPYPLRKTAGNMIHFFCGDSRMGMRGKNITFHSMAEAYLAISGCFHLGYFEYLRGMPFPIHETHLQEVHEHLRHTVSKSDIAPYLDMASYLPDDVLCKVDRASMAHSLEVRVPILDHRIVEFACSLPSDMKYKAGNGGKIILKKVLEKYIPRNLWNRPKQGFTPPISGWLSGELRELLLDTLSPNNLKKEETLNSNFVHSLISDHFSGRKNNQFYLWNLLQWMQWKNNHNHFIRS